MKKTKKTTTYPYSPLQQTPVHSADLCILELQHKPPDQEPHLSVCRDLKKVIYETIAGVCVIFWGFFSTIISDSLPSKVPVELSVALVLFFFFLLAASGMFTGWLFSISVATQKNPYASKLVKTARTLPVCYCMLHKFQQLF